jgi:hypothetical protein
MAYTTDIADAVSTTISKFVTLNTYQLIGHVANLEFWTAEVQHALTTLDGYDARNRIREHAQRDYIRRHDTREFSPSEAVFHSEFPDTYDLPKAEPDRHRLDAATIQTKRREVADAFYRFVRRCHKDGLLVHDAALAALERCGIGIEPGDFRD